MPLKSVKQFDKIIDNNISYLKHFLKKYRANDTIRTKLQDGLDFINRKRKDKTLYLSVIGEASTGKSTFINALLRDNFLEADLIPGTTVATMIIKHGKEYSVTVNYKNGTKKVIDKNSTKDNIRETIRSFITQIRTKDDLSSQIKDVVISHPSPALKKNDLSIIDTPGTNAVERWHEDVTQTAIKEYSDVSIILTQADVPLPETLSTFVRNNLSEVMGRCVFIANKIDMIPTNSRERQLSHLHKRIKGKFNLQDPKLFSFAPLLLLGEVAPEAKNDIVYSANDYHDLIAQSKEAEKAIYAILTEQRIYIQIEKLLSLLNDLFTFISNEIKSLTEDYTEQRKNLDKATKRSLKDFTDEMKAKYAKAYRDEATRVKEIIIKDVLDCVKENEDILTNSFQECAKYKEIKKLREELPAFLKELTKTISEAAREGYELFKLKYYEQMKNFWEEFDQFYNELDALAIRAVPDFKLKNINRSTKSLYSNDKIKKIYHDVVLLNPVSDFFVNVVSWFTGGPDAKAKFTEAKTKVIANVKQFMTVYTSDLKKTIENDIETYIKKIEVFINPPIDECFKAYRKLVDKMIKADNKKKAAIDIEIDKLKADLSDTESKKRDIESVIKEIKRKEISNDSTSNEADEVKTHTHQNDYVVNWTITSEENDEKPKPPKTPPTPKKITPPPVNNHTPAPPPKEKVSKWWVVASIILIATTFVITILVHLPSKEGTLTITNLDFVNMDGNHRTIDLPNTSFDLQSLQFLFPRITYDYIGDYPLTIELDIKYIGSNGRYISEKGSPKGYTFREKIRVTEPYSKNIVYTTKNTVTPRFAGTFTCEIWRKGQLLYSRQFTITRN